jgi:transcriptional regulator with XRE-family HTH domain
MATDPHLGGMTRRRSRRNTETDEDVAPAESEDVRLPTAEEIQFGWHVRRLRRARGRTQERLAERSGLSADTIRRLEHGAFSPSLDTLTKLCAGLEITRSTLFESFELADSDLKRELLDLLATRSDHEIKMALNLVRAMLDSLDGLEPDPDDAEDERAPLVLTVIEHASHPE